MIVIILIAVVILDVLLPSADHPAHDLGHWWQERFGDIGWSLHSQLAEDLIADLLQSHLLPSLTEPAMGTVVPIQTVLGLVGEILPVIWDLPVY